MFAALQQGPSPRSTTAGRVIRVLIRGRTDLGPGDTMRLHAEPKDVHAFDTKTGKRI